MLISTSRGPGLPTLFHQQEARLDERVVEHGTAAQSAPDRLRAADVTTVEFVFVIGRRPVETGGKLIIAWRWPHDWGDLQAENPAEAGAMTFHGPESAELLAKYDPYGGSDPWHHYCALTVGAGRLVQGQRVVLTLGDRTRGGGGWRAPTNVSRRFRFLTAVDHAGTNEWIRLPDPPPIEIVAGPPVRLLARAPSDAVIGQAFEVAVRSEDRWGNLSPLESAELAAADHRLQIDSSTTEWGIVRFGVTPQAAGDLRLRAQSPDGALEAETNPVRVHSGAPEWTLFWGDLHSGQTEIGCGNGSLWEHYAFARDVAGLQFLSHQANDHYVNLDDWREVRALTDEFYEPGRYVPFLGCEWSPPTRDGGDRNVIYRHDEPTLRRSGRFFVETQPDPEPDIPTAPEFHAAFREREVLVNLHAGGRPTNLDWYEPAIERLAEVHSTHGTSEWFFLDALERGYQVAVTAGSDGVMGRPGACHPGARLIRNVRSGLTGVYATGLTREALWEAFQAGRCYATSGPRIRLWVDVDGHPLGAKFSSASPPQVRVAVEGTAAIERVDLLRGVERIDGWKMEAVEHAADGRKVLRLLWGGAERRGTARLQRVDWNGSLEVTGGTVELIGPIGFQSACDTVEQAAPRRLTWRAQTAGNSMGVLLAVDGDDAARLEVRTGPATAAFNLPQVLAGEKAVEAGGVGRFLSMGPAPRTDAPRRREVTFVDHERLAGVCPYWVRVVQVDQSRAWSSPVYVTRIHGNTSGSTLDRN